MFTIDLLKGQGIPMRVTLQAVLVVAVAALLPVIVGIATFMYYTGSTIKLSVQQQQLAAYRAKISKLSDDVAHKEAVESRISDNRGCLDEVGSLVAGHYQWSPILAMLAKHMPESLVLTTLEVKDRSVKKEIQDPKNPNMTKEILVPAKTLVLVVQGTAGADNDAVRELREELYNSDVLGPMVENITVSQKTETLGGQSVISYQIDCMLRSKA